MTPSEVDRSEHRRVARLGILVALSCGAVQLAIHEQAPLASPMTLLAAAGLVGLALSAPRLLPDGALASRRGLPSVVLSRGLLNAAFNGSITFVPLMLVRERGLSLAGAGLVLAVASLGWSAGAWVQGRVRGARPLVRSRLVALGRRCLASDASASWWSRSGACRRGRSASRWFRSVWGWASGPRRSRCWCSTWPLGGARPGLGRAAARRRAGLGRRHRDRDGHLRGARRGACAARIRGDVGGPGRRRSRGRAHRGTVLTAPGRARDRSAGVTTGPCGTPARPRLARGNPGRDSRMPHLPARPGRSPSAPPRPGHARPRTRQAGSEPTALITAMPATAAVVEHLRRKLPDEVPPLAQAQEARPPRGPGRVAGGTARTGPVALRANRSASAAEATVTSRSAGSPSWIPRTPTTAPSANSA